MRGYEIHNTKHGSFAVWKARLRDEMPQADEYLPNPVLWWAKYLGPGERDWVACGVRTKREALALINAYGYDNR